MNRIEQYFADTGDNMAKLAERIGCAPSTITRPLRGERNPSVKLARLVEIHTRGRVTAGEFIAICMAAAKDVPAMAQAS